MLPALRYGSRGAMVQSWQAFLRGTGRPILADGIFGPQTERHTRNWQREHGLTADGIVGPLTAARAMTEGWALVLCARSLGAIEPISSTEMGALFGPVPYRPAPIEGHPERIIIDPDWTMENLVRVELELATETARPWLHREFAPRVLSWWQELHATSLIRYVLTFDGGFVPRFQRGTRVLSAHALGLAIDINREWNRYGHSPAPLGAEGSVLQLVPSAERHLIGWGGHWTNSPDPMHFGFPRPLSKSGITET